MCEVGLDEDGLEAGELLEAAVQEYHVHDVVADVALARQLLPVVGGEGQQRRHVEHDLVRARVRVHRVQAGRVI